MAYGFNEDKSKAEVYNEIVVDVILKSSSSSGYDPSDIMKCIDSTSVNNILTSLTNINSIRYAFISWTSVLGGPTSYNFFYMPITLVRKTLDNLVETTIDASLKVPNQSWVDGNNLKVHFVYI